jgi:quinol monooxygenase YgiN
MIIVQVTYTVKPAFVQANLENIRRFLADFAQLESNDFRYSVFRKNSNTFVHLSQYQNAEIQQRLLATPSFTDFQQQRDESGLVGEPVIDLLDPIGFSHEVF